MKKKVNYNAMEEYLKQDARMINLYFIISLILATLTGMFFLNMAEIKEENKNLRNQVNSLLESRI